MQSSEAANSSNAVSFLVDRHVQDGNGGRVAIYAWKQHVTYRSLARAINRMGNRLMQSGVRPEQRVALLLPDSPELICCFMAALKIGAVAVPLNTFCKPELIRYYLDDSRADTLIAAREYAELVHSIPREQLPYLRQINLYEDLENSPAADELTACPVADDDTAFWLYTSGSEGAPKAAIHRHAGMRVCAENYGRCVIGIRADDRVFSTSKIFFAYGLGNSVIFPFSVGAASIVVKEKPDPMIVRDVLARHQPTLFFSVPRLFKRLLEEKRDWRAAFNNVRTCVSAGEYLPASIFDAWKSATGQIIYDGIGSTEAMHIFCSNRIDGYRVGTSGTPVPGYQLKIVEDDCNDVAPGSTGRLMVRGKTLAKGYWNRYDLSQQAFNGEWLDTGDLFRQIDDGYFEYVGRQGEMFKSCGLWVSPTEIEQAMLSHQDVAEAAVVAAKASDGLYVPKAFVVIKPSVAAANLENLERRLYSHLERRLSRYKLPAAIDVLPELPLTGTGKIARAELRRTA